MRATVRSGQGRLHIAEPLGAAWRGLCGSVIVKPQEITRTDWQRLAAAAEPVCRYCAAIADAVAFEQQLAAEAVAGALHDAAVRPFARRA